jgi:hypothetical protein
MHYPALTLAQTCGASLWQSRASSQVFFGVYYCWCEEIFVSGDDYWFLQKQQPNYSQRGQTAR